MPAPTVASWATSLCFAALPLLTNGDVDLGTLLADAVFPAGLPAFRPVAGELRGTVHGNSLIDVIGDAAPAPPAPVTPVTHIGVADVACQAFEAYLKNQVHSTCKVSEVACVWGDTSVCEPDDYCKPSQHCGFVPENPFMKFESYTCDGSDLSAFRGVVTCNPMFTPQGVGIIVAAVAAALCFLCCCLQCLCCRRR